jgi:hypothetical protein
MGRLEQIAIDYKKPNKFAKKNEFSDSDLENDKNHTIKLNCIKNRSRLFY